MSNQSPEFNQFVESQIQGDVYKGEAATGHVETEWIFDSQDPAVVDCIFIVKTLKGIDTKTWGIGRQLLKEALDDTNYEEHGGRELAILPHEPEYGSLPAVELALNPADPDGCSILFPRDELADFIAQTEDLVASASQQEDKILSGQMEQAINEILANAS